jgi:hypothetical protein
VDAVTIEPGSPIAKRNSALSTFSFGCFLTSQRSLRPGEISSSSPHTSRETSHGRATRGFTRNPAFHRCTAVPRWFPSIHQSARRFGSTTCPAGDRSRRGYRIETYRQTNPNFPTNVPLHETQVVSVPDWDALDLRSTGVAAKMSAQAGGSSHRAMNAGHFWNRFPYLLNDLLMAGNCSSRNVR